MGVEHTAKKCKTCGTKVLAQRTKPSHVLHLILTLITCVWVAIWAVCILFPGPWRCTQCGGKV